MHRFIIKRIALGVTMIFAVTLFTFLLLHVGAGDVGRNILGLNADGATVKKLDQTLGVNRPVLVQYFKWLSHAIHLDFGQAWTFPQSVWDTLQGRFTITLTVVLVTMTLSILISTVLGVAAAVKSGWLDRFVQILGLLGFALPGFLVAFLLVTAFSLHWHIFNAIGYTEPTKSVGDWLKSITLPVIALAIGGIASSTQQIRGAVKDVLQLDYIRTLRARGISNRSVLFKHVLRNALGPALSVIGMQFVGLLSGAVVIEQIFAIPGVGQFSVSASKSSDIPAVMGLVVVSASLVIIINLVTDICAAFLNPKIRNSI